MKKKMIVIDCCTQCPFYFWYKYLRGYECVLKYNDQDDKAEYVPGWCPLPDAPLE
jgi:hypothetical protein